MAILYNSPPWPPSPSPEPPASRCRPCAAARPRQDIRRVRSAMDTIFLREFRIDEWEKQRAQTLEMEVEIGIPGNEVGLTDDIYDTVNYGEVVERINAELA